MGQGESLIFLFFFFLKLTNNCLAEDCPYAGMPGLPAGLGEMPGQGLGPIPWKWTREEASPREGPSKRICQARDGGSREGADIGLLLEEVKSALEEQTWLMWQMWATHTAMESEL